MNVSTAKKIVAKRANSLLDFKIKGAIATASRDLQCSVTIEYPNNKENEAFLKQQIQYLELLKYDAFVENDDECLKLHLGWS